jgi:hypothetical protein
MRDGTSATVTTSGGSITATLNAQGYDLDWGTADYNVSGTKLKFSNFSGGQLNEFRDLQYAIDTINNAANNSDSFYYKSASSSNNNGTGGTGSSGNALVITNINAAQYAQAGDGFFIEVFQAGKNWYSESGIQPVASGPFDDVAVSSVGSGYTATYTVRVALYVAGGVGRWTGSGMYDIYFMIDDAGGGGSQTTLLAQNVSFSSGAASVSATTFQPWTPPPGNF